MNIIARKSSLYTTVSFLNQVFQNDYIDGAFFEVVRTKDDQIVIFNPIYNNDVTIQTIQNSTFAQIQSEEVVTLRNALSYFVGTNKKVIIDVIPLLHPPLTDENAKTIASQNQAYISNVSDIIKSVGPLHAYIASIDQKLIFHMQKEMNGTRIGLIFYPDNLNYVDVDFYVFGLEAFNISIITQQIEKGKEVMILVKDCNDLSIMLNHTLENNIHTKDIEGIKNLSFVNNYPLIFQQLFTDI